MAAVLTQSFVDRLHLAGHLQINRAALEGRNCGMGSMRLIFSSSAFSAA